MTPARLSVQAPHDKAGVQFFDEPRRREAVNIRHRRIIARELVPPVYISARGLRLIFRRTSSTSEKPAVSLKATSLSVANSGRPVANEPDDATIAAAIVATRADLLIAKRIDDPVPWNQFDTNYFQHRWVWMRDLNQYFRETVTMFIPSLLASRTMKQAFNSSTDQGGGKRRGMNVARKTSASCAEVNWQH